MELIYLAKNDQRRGGSASDGRTPRQPGYKASQVSENNRGSIRLVEDCGDAT
jgi:hypothetical protein